MISRLRLSSYTLVFAVLISESGAAQRRAVSADSTKNATVRRLLDLTKTGELIISRMEALVPLQRRTVPDVPDAFWEAYLARARQSIPRIVDSLVPVYATRFNQAELNELVRFYSTPVGRHLVDAQPEISDESIGIGQRWGETIAREIADSLTRGEGTTAEFARQASMKSDLRNLVVAEEAYFADSVEYTERIGPGGLSFVTSTDNKILLLRVTRDGWMATIGNSNTKTVCAIFVGSTPIDPARDEGVPVCREGGTK